MSLSSPGQKDESIWQHIIQKLIHQVSIFSELAPLILLIFPFLSLVLLFSFLIPLLLFLFPWFMLSVVSSPFYFACFSPFPSSLPSLLFIAWVQVSACKVLVHRVPPEVSGVFQWESSARFSPVSSHCSFQSVLLSLLSTCVFQICSLRTSSKPDQR